MFIRRFKVSATVVIPPVSLITCVCLYSRTHTPHAHYTRQTNDVLERRITQRVYNTRHLLVQQTSARTLARRWKLIRLFV